MNPVHFSQGMDRLSAQVLNDTGMATHQVFGTPATWNGPDWVGPVMCEVLGATAMRFDDGDTGITFGGRWLYSLREIAFRNAYVEGITANGMLQTKGHEAINLSEWGNTGEDGAEDRIRSGLTAGQLEFFELLPTPTGAAVATFFKKVQGGATGITGPADLYIFERAGEFWGPC